MPEKKINLTKYFIIFFILLFALSFVIDYELQIGKNPDRFFAFVLKGEGISEEIQKDINPDEYYRKEAKAIVDARMTEKLAEEPDNLSYLHPDQLQYRYAEENLKIASQQTWGSQLIYQLLAKIPFGEGSPILNFRMWRVILLIDLLIVFGALYLKKRFSAIPSKVQIVCEMIYDFIADLVVV